MAFSAAVLKSRSASQAAEAELAQPFLQQPSLHSTLQSLVQFEQSQTLQQLSLHFTLQSLVQAEHSQTLQQQLQPAANISRDRITKVFIGILSRLSCVRQPKMVVTGSLYHRPARSSASRLWKVSSPSSPLASQSILCSILPPILR